MPARENHHPECAAAPLDYCPCDIVDERDIALARIRELVGERDRARDVAVALEQENAHLTEVLLGIRQRVANLTIDVIRASQPEVTE